MINLITLGPLALIAAIIGRTPRKTRQPNSELAVILAVAYGSWSRQLALFAQRAAESQERQRIAARIQSDWNRDDPEIRVLYDDFFERLQSGQTTAEERELYFSHALEMELETRRLWGMDLPWCTTLEVLPKADFKAHGIALQVTATYELGSQTFKQEKQWLRTYEWPYSLIEMCEDPGKTEEPLDLPAELELRTSLNLAVSWGKDVPEEEFRRHQRSSWDPPNPIWTGHKVLRRPVTLLRTLPDNYPPAITHPEVARAVERGFEALMFWAGDGLRGFEFVNAGPLYIGGWLEVLDYRCDQALGRTRLTSFTWSRGGTGHYGSPESAWPSEFLEAVRRKDLTNVAIRIVPDRKSALSVPDLSVYYGLVIERAVPVADFTERDTLGMQISTARTLVALGGYAEAERRLRDVAEQCERSEAVRHMHWRRVLDVTVKLYDAWHAAEPGKGYDAKAAEWRAKREDWRASTQPAAQPLTDREGDGP